MRNDDGSTASTRRDILAELAESWSDRAEDLRLTAVMAAARAGSASTVPIARLRREAWAWATASLRCRRAVECDNIDALAEYLARRSGEPIVGAAFQSMAAELMEASSCGIEDGQTLALGSRIVRRR